MGYMLRLLVIWAATVSFAADWKPAESPLTTPWTASVKADRPLPEYPRPQLVRAKWTNLNGLWDYAIRPKDDARPAQFEGKLLVPFAVESALSGVKRPLTPEQRLWYRRSFTASRRRARACCSTSGRWTGTRRYPESGRQFGWNPCRQPTFARSR